MRRILSLPGLAVAVWVSCLAFMSLLAVMAAALAWHPHFLPATAALALVIVSGLALIVGASWLIVRGPDRRRALACLLIGVAPIWFLAGFFLYGLAVVTGQKLPINAATRLLAPLALSLLDLDARFVYPRRTAGEKVVMISAPMPEADARAQVAAMDRHVGALEARLNRKLPGMIHWVRGPLFGIAHRAVIGMCLGTWPGEESPDAEGLCATDRHEVAHCVLTGLCSAGFDPPALLAEGWAQDNQGADPLDQASQVWESLEDVGALTLRELVGPDWYDRHEWPVYVHGAPLVNFLLERFGPERFLRLYSTCSQATFESDCRRILGLDLDALDAAFRADIERRTAPAGSVEQRRLERLQLAPNVAPGEWRAFFADYFAAAGRMLAHYQNARLTADCTGSTTDARGQTETHSFAVRVHRSGAFASLRRRSSGFELAFLVHPRRSIRASRDAKGGPWKVEDDSRRTADLARRCALRRIEEFDVGRDSVVLVALADELSRRSSTDQVVVAALERFNEEERPRVRVRIEDRSTPDAQVPWRSSMFLLAADDLYAVQSARLEGAGPDKEIYQSELVYDRHEGIPVLRSVRTAISSPAGARGTFVLEVVDRRFGPIPEEEFDPDRFLDSPQVTDIGGTITFLSRSKDGANLINSHDLGRQVQQSYYSGSHVFGRAHPGWKGWPWNPIGSGDVYNHPSRVIEQSNDGKTLYVKTIPMQWALNNVQGECTFETWIMLEQAAAHVRCRLNNNRPDRTQYASHDQELPAVYTVGKLHRLFTYDGDRPFEGQPLKLVKNAEPPWTDWKATANWAALVDGRGIGVGVIHPGVYSFIGGFHGKPNTGGPKDNSTGYIAPVRKEILDHNIVYKYRYMLAVGTLEEIRAAASANRVRDTRPDFRFDRDRGHWTFHNARDTGFPIAGDLRIKTTGDDPQWIGPEQWWRAEDVPKLFIRAAFRTRGDHAQIFWSVPGQGFSDRRRVELTIRPDGMLRTYAVDLASAPHDRGTITGLRIDPLDANGPDDEVRLESISRRPE